MNPSNASQRPAILVTGGAGFIGSHVCVELINSGYLPVVVDNLCNSKEESLKRVAKIAGLEPVFYKVDINDKDALRKVFAAHSRKDTTNGPPIASLRFRQQ